MITRATFQAHLWLVGQKILVYIDCGSLYYSILHVLT